MTIELTEEEAERLRAMAIAKGTDESGVVRELIGDLPAEKTLPQTGAELIERLKELNLYRAVRISQPRCAGTGA